MSKQEIYLGVDIGGTGIKGAKVDLRTGELVTERFRLDTPKPATPEEVAATFRELVKKMDYSGPIGVGFPAIVRRGVALSAANISDQWIGRSVEDTLSKALDGQPVFVANDADVAGIGSMHYGVGKAYLDRNVLLLTLGTGIGSALFVEGNLVPNTEFGHLYLKTHKVDAEKFVSNFLRKSKGWSWNKFGKRLAKYIDHVDMLLSPDLIILGGGASKNFEKFEKHLRVDTRVVAAELLNNAGTIGAALYAKQRTSK